MKTAIINVCTTANEGDTFVYVRLLCSPCTFCTDVLSRRDSGVQCIATPSPRTMHGAVSPVTPNLSSALISLTRVYRLMESRLLVKHHLFPSNIRSIFLIFLHTSSTNSHLQFLRSYSPASHSHTTASSWTLQAPPTHPVHPQAKSAWVPSPLTTTRHTTPLMPLRYRTPPTHNTQPPLAHLPGTRMTTMLSCRRMMGSPRGTVAGSGIMEERRMLKILLRMETMRLRGMLLVGRRLGGGRLLVEWPRWIVSCFFF